MFVIEDLFNSITEEFDITTIINTHDMNSVMGIGENIIFIYQGEKEWQKTRSRVRSAVKDIAQELIDLYTKRTQIKGFAFSPDIDMQNDFERRFEYEETDDQLRCIQEIKNDMEKPYPMDRLLCGDVGFGKTEVALRAAFKCVADGKQCAILVPTTIIFRPFSCIIPLPPHPLRSSAGLSRLFIRRVLFTFCSLCVHILFTFRCYAIYIKKKRIKKVFRQNAYRFFIIIPGCMLRELLVLGGSVFFFG